jgi:mono/diheme cytochrome c family protein
MHASAPKAANHVHPPIDALRDRYAAHFRRGEMTLKSMWFVPVTVTMLGALLAGCASSPAASGAADTPAPPSTPLPSGVTSDMVRSGRELYTGLGQCSTCHGDEGRGTMLGPNLIDREWLNIDGSYDQIVGVVTNGIPQPKQHPQPMPARGGGDLTVPQIRAVAAYVWTLSPRTE